MNHFLLTFHPFRSVESVTLRLEKQVLRSLRSYQDDSVSVLCDAEVHTRSTTGLVAASVDQMMRIHMKVSGRKSEARRAPLATSACGPGKPPGCRAILPRALDSI
jgi:hypothetical protein